MIAMVWVTNPLEPASWKIDYQQVQSWKSNQTEMPQDLHTKLSQRVVTKKSQRYEIHTISLLLKDVLLHWPSFLEL